MATKRRWAVLTLCLCALSPALRAEVSAWEVLRHRLFGARPLLEDTATMALYTPARAEDAAAVPVTVTLGGERAARASRLWLIVDRNPSPLAAKVEFGPAYWQHDVGERRVETRLRVDAFSKVRAVLEMNDGTLFHAERFVAGAGGCSAPGSALTDSEDLGIYRLATRGDAARAATWRETLVSIKHPNNTGFQRDARGSIIPARYVERISVAAGGLPLLAVNEGISLAENPQLRFSFASTLEPSAITLEGQDTSGLSLSPAVRAGN